MSSYNCRQLLSSRMMIILSFRSLVRLKTKILLFLFLSCPVLGDSGHGFSWSRLRGRWLIHFLKSWFLNLCFLSTFSCSGLARFCMTWVYFSCPPLLSLFLHFPRNWEFSWSSSLFLRVSLLRVPCSLFQGTSDSLFGVIHAWFTLRGNSRHREEILPNSLFSIL